MKLSKERKVLFVLFGLGLVCLAIDRMFFAPSEASASTPTEEAGAPPATESKDAKAEAPAPVAPSGPSLAQQLAKSKWVFTGGGRDAFEAPKEWVGAVVHQDDPPPETESDFARSHKLSAVLNRTDPNTKVSQPLAVIAGGTYAVNDEVDGYRIKELHTGKPEDQWALLERNDERVKLRRLAPKPAGSMFVADKFPVGEPGSIQMGPPIPRTAQNPPGNQEPH